MVNNVIIGTTMESIDAKKMESYSGHFRIDHNVTIKNVSDVKVPLFPKEKIAKIDFEFKTVYTPQKEGTKEIGHIMLSGHILFKGMDQKQKNFWKKHKKLPEEIAIPTINHILRRGIIKAVEVAETLLLPPPINMPTVKPLGKKPEKRKYDTTYIG